MLGAFKSVRNTARINSTNQPQQLEAQRLVARMLEVQMHLPRLTVARDVSLGGRDCNRNRAGDRNDEHHGDDVGDDDVDDVDEGDDDDDDDDDDGDDDDDDDDKRDGDDGKPGSNRQPETRPRFGCPYSGCRRRKAFGAQADLKSHFQSRAFVLPLDRHMLIYFRP